MKHPHRWLDQGDAAAPDIRALLEVAEPSRLMTDAELARSAAQVAATAATPIGASALVPVIKKLLGILLGIGGGGAIVGGLAYLLHNSDPAAQMMATEIPAVVATASAEPVRIDLPSVIKPGDTLPPVVVSTAVPRANSNPMPVPNSKTPQVIEKPLRVAPAVSTSSPPPRVDPLADEVAILEEARQVLVTNPKSALDWLDEHERSHPNGKMRVEREFLAIDALVAIGRGREAMKRAEALLERVRGTPYESRVERKVYELDRL